MGRFLLGTWPFVGCVYPFMSLAAALRERGHEVAVYTGSRAEPVVASEGLTFFPFDAVAESRVWEVVIAAESGTPNMWRRPGLAFRTIRDWLAGTVEGQIEDLERLAAEWHPDVIITEPSMWGANLVIREKLGIPVALFSSLIGCLIPGPDAPPWGPGLPPPRTPVARFTARALAALVEAAGRPLRRRMDGVRARHGLQPAGLNLNALLGQAALYLIPSVPELDYNRRDLPSSVRYVGPCVWNRASSEARAEWLDHLPAGRPWVHVTEGSLHYQGPFLLRAAVQGLAGCDCEVIITTGPHRRPESLGLPPAAPNIHITQWVSHTELLPRCQLLVTTGGAGTVMAALQAGVPMVIVPTHWDKPDNAQRLVEAGAAIRLNPRQCTPRRLRSMVLQGLGSSSLRAQAQRLASLFKQYPGPAGAAQLLESLEPASRRGSAAMGHPGTTIHVRPSPGIAHGGYV